MNTRRRRKGGFLEEYKLDQAYLQKPDAARGRPGVFAGHAPDGTPVLIMEWLRSSSAKDGDLEQIWRHELRQLHRLAGYPGAAECIAHLNDAGFDAKGFYLVIAPGQRHPLQSLLDSAGIDHWLKQPRGVANRSRMWANLKLLAFGLEALHSQGLLHRNLDAWAVLTSGGTEPDFQLTGFEWSMRIASVESSTPRGASMAALRVSDSFLQDWLMFGLLAADLMGAKRARVFDLSIAPYDIADHLSVEEARLLRGIVQLQPLTPLNGETIAARIDNVLRGLAAEVANRQAKLHLALRLGTNSPLAERIRQASQYEIEADDSEGQLQFVVNDLREAPLLLAVKQKNSTDWRLVLRGKHLFYRLQEFRPPRAPTASWEFAYCERIDEIAPAPVNLLGHRSLEPESLEVMTLRDAIDRFPRLRGKLSSWDDLRRGFEQASAPPSPEQTAHRALTLLQLLEALYAAADAFTVELQSVPEAVLANRQEDGAWLCVKLRQDPEREALSKALDLQPPAVRFLKAIDNDGLGAEGWVLTDGRSLGERDQTDSDWQFQRVLSRDGQPDSYLFAGTDSIPYLRDPVLLVASVGRSVQFKRRLKALKALKDHQELLRMMVDPRQRVVESHDKLAEDAAFDQLDPPKQEALRQLTSTLPLFLVQGPPGVGKTRLVRDLVTRRFADEPTSRLLLTAQSNAAVDHLMDELEEVLQIEGPGAPLIVRSTKKDAMEVRSRFDIQEQTRRLVKRLADSSLAKEVQPRLRRSLLDLASAAEPVATRSRGSTAVAGRAIEQAHRVFEGVVARAANVVFATTNSAELERLIDERGQFDWAIVEEAAKATGSELISPLLLSHRRLMIGDHKQLPAFASDQLKSLLTQPARVQEAMKLGEEFIGRSLRDATTEDLLDEVEEDEMRLPALCAEALRLLTYFESAIEAEFKRQSLRKTGRPIAKKLTAQHRMHPAIAQLVSRCFYGDLETDPGCAVRFKTVTRPFHSLDLERLPMAPIVVIDMPYVQAKIKQQQGDCNPAWHNPMEVRAALEILSLLRSSGSAKSPTLAVLSPYGRQRRHLAEAVQEQSGSLLRHLTEFRAPSHSGQLCHTVDSFQGSEADIVVVSLVRNNHHSSVQKALGFLSDPRRMNVLLSRAKWQLVLIASTDFLKEVIDAAKGGDDEPRVDFLHKMLDGLAAGEKEGAVVRVPFERLIREVA
jgi:hypothetical protein